jgi:hypothetical protein
MRRWSGLSTPSRVGSDLSRSTIRDRTKMDFLGLSLTRSCDSNPPTRSPRRPSSAFIAALGQSLCTPVHADHSRTHARAHLTLQHAHARTPARPHALHTPTHRCNRLSRRGACGNVTTHGSAQTVYDTNDMNPLERPNEQKRGRVTCCVCLQLSAHARLQVGAVRHRRCILIPRHARALARTRTQTQTHTHTHTHTHTRSVLCNALLCERVSLSSGCGCLSLPDLAHAGIPAFVSLLKVIRHGIRPRFAVVFVRVIGCRTAAHPFETIRSCPCLSGRDWLAYATLALSKTFAFPAKVFEHLESKVTWKSKQKKKKKKAQEKERNINFFFKKKSALAQWSCCSRASKRKYAVTSNHVILAQ